MAIHPQIARPFWPDALIGGLLILWMAEALARLPFQPALVAILYAVTGARLLLDQQTALAGVRAALPMMPFVVLCLASTLWSAVPQATLIAGMQLAFTVVVGAWLGQRFGVRGLAWLIAGALVISMAASALNLTGFSTPTHAREGGFLGIYLNKNALGQRAALLIWTLAYLLQTGPRARPVLLVGLAIALAMLWLSASVSSWALTGVGAGALTVLHLRAKAGVGWRIAVVVLATLVLALGAALAILGVNPLTTGLEAVGKDATLTGRTVLWSIAMEEARAAPLWGAGYMSFWADPAHNQQVAMIRLVFGPTVNVFHNFLLEALVALGPAGAVALALPVAVCFVRLWRLAPGAARRWALITLAAFVVLSALGSSLFRPHEVTLLLCVALLSAASGSQDRLRAYSNVWRPITASQ